jgi:hypothetical protein
MSPACTPAFQDGQSIEPWKPEIHDDKLEVLCVGTETPGRTATADLAAPL